MKYNPEKHHRRSTRLRGYDYSQPGAYFITICTQKRACLFGDVVDGKMVMNPYGRIVQQEWFRSVKIRREIQLYSNEFVVMPNHVHGIVWIVGDKPSRNVGATGRSPLPQSPHGPKPRSVAAFIAAFKSAVTKHINQMCGTPGASVWQRNYYEHIIRNEHELNRIRKYIVNNPLKWETGLKNADTNNFNAKVRP